MLLSFCLQSSFSLKNWNRFQHYHRHHFLPPIYPVKHVRLLIRATWYTFFVCFFLFPACVATTATTTPTKIFIYANPLLLTLHPFYIHTAIYLQQFRFNHNSILHRKPTTHSLMRSRHQLYHHSNIKPTSTGSGSQKVRKKGIQSKRA